MIKKSIPLVLASILLSGCAADILGIASSSDIRHLREEIASQGRSQYEIAENIRNQTQVLREQNELLRLRNEMLISPVSKASAEMNPE